MLRTLYIENVAVIQRATLPLETGLNVLTGETGAGKSILIGAVNAILGNRTSKDMVRQGADRALISALFEELSPAVTARAEEMGYDCPDGSLLIVREIGRDGRNTCKIGGRPANVSILKELGQLLINVHGQHDSQQLLDEKSHIRVLDTYGQLEPLLERYQTQYVKVRDLKRTIADLEARRSERERQIDLLSYQIGEITEADPAPGEDLVLEEQINKAKYAELIAQNLQAAQDCLNGGEEGSGAIGLLQTAAQSLQNIREYLPATGTVGDKLTALLYELQEHAADLSALSGGSDADAYVDIDFLENRLATLQQLEKKYGATLDEVLAYRDDCQHQLEALAGSDEEILSLKEQMRDELRAATDLAQQLSAKRKKAGERFSAAICRELAFLNMSGVTFVTEVVSEPKLHRDGMDAVRFLISANVGEAPKSISKIASGGELSRIMLAIKNILAEKDQIDTLIFDEIDTGVSGSAAQKIGQKLKETAASHQIICVTHSASLAAYGGNHLLISKHSDGVSTFTDIRPLGEEERVRELARIISGDAVSGVSLQNAREMLARAQGGVDNHPTNG